jgi:2-(1,2-epoxy-1,2-dihydrophenyl)acetyl-CoA isomerase
LGARPRSHSGVGAEGKAGAVDLTLALVANKLLRITRGGEASMNLATSTKTFDCSIDDGLAHIVLNQPDRGNPIDGEFCREFNLAIAELSERADVRAVLISARGRLFSVGGDLMSLVKQGEALPRTIKAWTADLHTAIARMVRMRAPVVAAVHGNVAGGSVSLMAAADLVVMAESARISAAFSRIGFSPDSGSTTTVTRRIGMARARRFFLLAETLDAKSALTLGLVDDVVADDAVQGEAERIARELAGGPTEAYGAIKRLFSQTLERSLETQLEEEAQTLAAISRTADALEGVKAFVEKRKPAFVGR